MRFKEEKTKNFKWFNHQKWKMLGSHHVCFQWLRHRQSKLERTRTDKLMQRNRVVWSLLRLFAFTWAFRRRRSSTTSHRPTTAASWRAVTPFSLLNPKSTLHVSSTKEIRFTSLFRIANINCLKSLSSALFRFRDIRVVTNFERVLHTWLLIATNPFFLFLGGYWLQL